jgi:signal transduction histidine kinase
VSHDLRNPLAAILLGASGLRRAAEKGEVPNRWIDSISSAGERMKHLIETILASSSIDAGTLTITPRSQLVRVLLDEAFGMFERSAAAKEIRLSRQVPEDLQVEADPDRLLQVLSNLIGNALKFTPRSGTVSIGAERENDGVRFFVEDTGPGIADDQLARLFERHWQAHRGAHAGLGLGLYIAKEIVALHGGRIWAETKLGSGTSFFFTIPTQPHRQSGEPADQRIAASAAESSDGDHERRPTA